MSIQVFGLPVSRGVAIGRAVLVASSRVDVAHYYIDETRVEAEVDRLRQARDVVTNELTTLKRDLPAEAPAELPALLDVHLMLLHDEAMAGATRHWIEVRHYNAEWALSAQLEVVARQFDEMEDDYFRERKADLEQVVERVLRALSKAGPLLPSTARGGRAWRRDPLVLVANDIAPADMLQFKGSVFSGFVTDVGGKTSHTAIVARSMDIPAVVGAREASRLIRQDDWIVIDGDSGVVVVDPSPIVLEEYRFRQRQSELERARLHRLRHTPSVTLDGEPVELLANIELPRDAPVALDSGAVGIGLFRSEFLFMNRDGELPSEDEQFEAYRGVVEAMRGPAGDHPHCRHRRRQAARSADDSRVETRARIEPCAGVASDSLELGRARHVSAAAEGDSASQRIRQGSIAASDGGAALGDQACARSARQGQAPVDGCWGRIQ